MIITSWYGCIVLHSSIHPIDPNTLFIYTFSHLSGKLLNIDLLEEGIFYIEYNKIFTIRIH